MLQLYDYIALSHFYSFGRSWVEKYTVYNNNIAHYKNIVFFRSSSIVISLVKTLSSDWLSSSENLCGKAPSATVYNSDVVTMEKVDRFK